MKNFKLIILGLFVCLCNITYAQSFEKSFKRKGVATAPVFPGCEQYKGSNKALMKCLVKELQKLILNNLNTEIPWASAPKKTFKVKIKFDLTPAGKMENIEAIAGDSELVEQVEGAFYKISFYLEDKNLKIEPARDEYNVPVSTSFNQGVAIRNPNYARDLIKYYNSIGYTPSEIVSELRKENIFKYNEQQISRILGKN